MTRHLYEPALPIMRHQPTAPFLLTLLLALLTGFPVVAQTQAIHLLRSEAPITGAMAKLAVEALRGLDAAALASADDHYLKVRMDAAVPEQAILQALNGQGALYSSVSATHHRSGPGAALPAPPNSATGIEGQRAYEEAKQRWIAAHPEEHQRLLNGEDAPSNKTP